MTCSPRSHPSLKLKLGCTEQDGPPTAGWSHPKRYSPSYSRTISTISSQSLHVPALDPLTAQPLGEKKAPQELRVQQFCLLCLWKWRANDKRLFLSIHSVVSVCKQPSSCTFLVRLVGQGCRTQTVYPPNSVRGSTKKKKNSCVMAQTLSGVPEELWSGGCQSFHRHLSLLGREVSSDHISGWSWSTEDAAVTAPNIVLSWVRSSTSASERGLYRRVFPAAPPGRAGPPSGTRHRLGGTGRCRITACPG